MKARYLRTNPKYGYFNRQKTLLVLATYQVTISYYVKADLTTSSCLETSRFKPAEKMSMTTERHGKRFEALGNSCP